MARAKKLNPAAVRKIFKSIESAPMLAKQFGVSTNLIYLIRQGRIHKKITGGTVAPIRAKGRRQSPASASNIDVKALADAIIDRLIARLFSRGGR